MKLGLRGLVAAPHTPCAADGSVAVDVVPAQAEWLARSGVIGAFVGGTTGEWYALSVAERLALFDAWAAHRGELLLIAHVGHLCQSDAAALAAHAGKCGMHATSALAPTFVRPANATELAKFFAPIAAAAPELPFYVYHMPGMTGVDVPPDEQLAVCGDVIPNFAGMKFTDPDLFAFDRCRVEFGERFEFIWGVDEVLLAALGHGAVAAVGSTYNYAAPLNVALMRAHERGDRDKARELAARSAAMVDVLVEFGVLRAGKALMQLRGVECGPPRPPVLPLDDDERERLFARVEATGALADFTDP